MYSGQCFFKDVNTLGSFRDEVRFVIGTVLLDARLIRARSVRGYFMDYHELFNGKPQASVFRNAVACGLPLNEWFTRLRFGPV